MVTKKTAPFANFIDVLKNMPPEQKQKIIENHQNFHRLKTWCEAKKMIEVLPKMTGIKVLLLTKEVCYLKTIIEILNPGGFQWINLKGINEREPIKKKK